MENSPKSNKILSSMQGSRRAQPQPELKARIRAKVLESETLVINFKQKSYMIAAAVILLILNISVIRQRIVQTPTASTGVVVDQYAEHSLMTNFKLYQE